jgi:magnesium chelatase subunit I
MVAQKDRFEISHPDVTVADLIDIDPIKAANLKLSYADDRDSFRHDSTC